MNLQDLRYLVAVAEHRHFGRAAEACFVSQPTLSAQIKKLERELGVELFERSSRHVMLTPVGSQVLDHARAALVEADAVRDTARRMRDPETGQLRIGIFPTLAPYLLPHVVPQLHERFPRLELLLVEEKTEELVHRLRIGALDAAVLALPVHDEHLRAEALFDEDFLLAVPVDHPLASMTEPAPLSVLTGTSVLLLEDGHCLRDQALSVCHLSGASERQGFRATSLETLRQMVAAGVGITLLPELAVRPPVPVSPAIRLVRFADPVPSRRIGLLWRTTSPLGRLLTDVAAILRSVPADLVRPVPATEVG